MQYKLTGWDTTIACTPAGRSFLDNGSCREINKCTRDCIPKTLKCEWCGSKNSRLNVMEEVDTGNKVSICDSCEKTIEDNIVRN